ncbi:MAG: septal ring lytic transglycosylase RlpA family protein [Alphaproteobacteria bacterium]
MTKTMKGSRRWAVLAAALCALLLSACAETELAVNTVKVIGVGEGERAGSGRYKLGDPYQVDGVWYHPKYDANYDETGIASWYGKPFHGQPTANGAIYDMNALTAAHKTLPMPSHVRVTNLENGRSIVVTVNDRGPFVHGRIIDLSRRAAQLLGLESAGTAMVRVQVLPEEEQPAVLLASLDRIEADGVRRQPRVEAAPSGSVEVAFLEAPANGGLISSAAAAEFQEEKTTPIMVAVPSVRMFVQAGSFAVRDNALDLRSRLETYGPAAVTVVDLEGRRLYRVRLGPYDVLEEADATLAEVISNGYTDARLIVD